MLSHRTRSAPAPTASATWSRVSHSTSTASPGNASRTACEGLPDATGGVDVVVLDERGVAQRHPVVDPAAAADRVLLQRPQPRRGLAGVADQRAGALDRVHPRRVSVATPDSRHSRFSVVRSTVSSRRTGPDAVSTTSPGCTRSPSAAGRATDAARLLDEQERGHRQAGDHPVPSRDHVRGGHEIGRDGRGGGDVHAGMGRGGADTEIFGQRGDQQRRHLRRVEAGRGDGAAVYRCAQVGGGPVRRPGRLGAVTARPRLRR